MASVPNTTTSASSHSTTFRVAIIGGGIGGLSLALGLLKHPHIDVHIYESAPSFGEIGAGVAFGPNAQRALELIGPKTKEAFLKHATSNMWASHADTAVQYMVGQGEHADEIIVQQKTAKGMQSLHRAHFLEELVKAVPPQRAHFNKRLETIEDQPEKEVVLHFKDGTIGTTDAVIGADGIHSHVREHLLGKEASQPVYSGCVAYRGLVSMDAAIEKLGAEYAQNSTLFCGSGKMVLSYPIDHGHILNIAAIDIRHEHWQHEKSIVPAEHGEINRLFKGWGRAVQRIIELLDTPDLAAWQICEAPVAPFYSKNRVVMMGDAAHATTPFQGQGAGQAIEDALVLATLLAEITNPSHIPNAFTAFDQTRRIRSQRVVKTSREAGNLYGMQREGIGNDIQKMRKDLSVRMHWIWHRNLVEQNREAVELFKESL